MDDKQKIEVQAEIIKTQKTLIAELEAQIESLESSYVSAANAVIETDPVEFLEMP